MATAGRAEASAPPPVDYQAEVGLTARERLRKAISLLEVGNGPHAKVELQAYLIEEPNSKLAKKLLGQIDVDPVEELGEEYFLYTMQPGDSLSTLAKRQLGDAMLFHVLGRYNQIDNPSEMKVGQTIKLPGKPSADLQVAEAPAQVDTGAESTSAESEAGEIAEGTQEAAETEPDSDTGAEPSAEATETEEPDEQEAAEQEVQSEAESEAAETEPTEKETELDDMQSLILEANNLSAAGDYKGAAILLEQGLARFPDADLIKGFAAANYLTFAELLTAEGRLDDANVALRRSLELDPSNGDAVERLVENYLAQSDQAASDGETEQALRLLDEAKSIDPDNAGLAPRMVTIQLNQAKQYADGGRFDDAARALTDARKLDPQNAEITPRLVNVHMAQAKQLTDSGQHDLAADVLEKAQALDPDNANVRRLAVANYEAQADKASAEGRALDAIAAIKRAKELNPENGAYSDLMAKFQQQAKADQLYDTGVAHMKAKDYQKAYDSFNAVLDVYPEHKSAKKDLKDVRRELADKYHREAMTAFRRQDLDKALGIWEGKVLEIDPNHGPAKIYSDQARDLKKKLDTIGEGSAPSE